MDNGAQQQATARRLVAIVCAAQVLVQIGAFFWPALLPRMIPLWSLTNTEAGWITASFYAAYMVSVPILVTLTDRVDPKHVYLFGVAATVVGHGGFGWLAEGFWSAMALRALTGLGWAGTYMTGLKLLTDQVDAKLMSRAVTGHAASIGVAGALSFATADVLAELGGWKLAFFAASASSALAWLMVVLLVPRRSAVPAPAADGQGLFNFMPVLRNRSAMAYSIGYCVHTLEMSALRGWGVAFLGYVAATTGAGTSLLSPAAVMTLLGLIGVAASVAGNETAIRLGRRRLILLAMTGSIVIALSLGAVGPLSYWLAVALLFVYGLFIWLDSSSLTAGAAGTAEPSRRGATLAVHSSLGYAGGLIGPIVVGWSLDCAGGMSHVGWAVAFGIVAALMLAALIAFRLMRPRGLVGDRAAQPAGPAGS
jgi:predicted MFS family arabinose efflux permease